MPGRFINYFLLLLVCTGCQPHRLVSNEKKAIDAGQSLKGAGHSFLTCIVENDLDSCIDHFKRRAKNPYEKNIVANIIYNIDPKVSYKLHQEAYKAKPGELLFIMEYALELHRKGMYSEAASLYEKFAEVYPDNFRVKVWLADCYINTGMTDKSVRNWMEADHSGHHIEIENALHDIYGKTDLYTKRNHYRDEIKKGNVEFFYELFYLDLNWESDWWNIGVTDENYLKADISLLNERLNAKSEMYNVIEAYVKIKNPEAWQFINTLADVKSQKFSEQKDITNMDYNKTMNEVEKEIMEIIKSSIAPDDSTIKVKEDKFDKAGFIRATLLTHSLILNGNLLPEKGKITSDFLEVCFTNSVITKSEFYKERGSELLKRAEDQKDADFLDLYAHIMPLNNREILRINKKGWLEYNDERFAWTYLMTTIFEKKLDTEEIHKAVEDFPSSSRIFLINTQKAKIDNRNMKPYFIELIKREFRSINSGIGLGSTYSIGRSSYPLKLYFELLRKELRDK